MFWLPKLIPAGFPLAREVRVWIESLPPLHRRHARKRFDRAFERTRDLLAVFQADFDFLALSARHNQRDDALARRAQLARDGVERPRVIQIDAQALARLGRGLVDVGDR